MAVVLAAVAASTAVAAGRWFEGQGDQAYIDALNTAFRTFTPDAEYQVRTRRHVSPLRPLSESAALQS